LKFHQLEKLCTFEELASLFLFSAIDKEQKYTNSSCFSAKIVLEKKKKDS